MAQGTAIAESTVSAIARATAEAGSTAAAANAAEAKRLLEAQQATQTAEATLGIVVGIEVEQTRAALEATVTAQAATLEAPTLTPTATATPPPATATPWGTLTPQATGTATATPTATSTPTPDITATANVEKLFELSSQQASAGCKINTGSDLAKIWGKYESQLGCPVGEVVGGEFAEQPFEKGFMIWSGIYGEIYAMVGEDKGTWSWYDQKTIDSFGPSDSGSCTVRVPSGVVQPVRGFGAVWCGDPDLAKDIGFGLIPEYGVSTNLIQKFQNGVIIRDSQKRFWILFADKVVYVREK